MAISQMRKATALPLILTLAACGGGGGGGGNGGGSSTPVAETGFAEPGDSVSQGITYRPKNVNVFITRDQGATLDIDTDEPVRIEFGDNGTDETVRITVSGVVYRLTENADGEFRYNVGSTPMVMTRQATSDNNAAELYTVFSALRSSIPAPEGFAFVVGHDTDPATVSAETGTATYRGVIHANAVSADTTVYDTGAWLEDDLASGTITLNANFNSDNVSGEFSLGNFDGVTTAETYIVPSVSINGNGFSGTFTVEDGTLASGQTLENAEINGNFFGADTGAIGGTIYSEIHESGEDTIYIQGGYLADAD
ncbi:transferrin-binding protein-like solute binding protein [Loktanella agnita]|uniref:transferrin-binding protein-like solute binding protein n=1 Tax=Loktanella agnita TaxID=287097 RepID=UPI0039874627